MRPAMSAYLQVDRVIRYFSQSCEVYGWFKVSEDADIRSMLSNGSSCTGSSTHGPGPCHGGRSGIPAFLPFFSAFVPRALEQALAAFETQAAPPVVD